MNFDQTSPCADCPFRRGKHAIRLHPGRVEEIAGNMLDVNGGTFSCHKETHGRTTARGYRASVNDVHCAGALIFAERNDNQTRSMQIAKRLGLYDPSQFRSVHQRRLIFATIEEMLATALQERRHGHK
jgi:hypothetical protein